MSLAISLRPCTIYKEEGEEVVPLLKGVLLFLSIKYFFWLFSSYKYLEERLICAALVLFYLLFAASGCCINLFIRVAYIN